MFTLSANKTTEQNYLNAIFVNVIGEELMKSKSPKKKLDSVVCDNSLKALEREQLKLPQRGYKQLTVAFLSKYNQFCLKSLTTPWLSSVSSSL